MAEHEEGTKRTFLTKVQQYQLFKQLDGMRAEIDAAKMGYEELTKQVTAELGFPVTRSHLKDAVDNLGIRLFRRYTSNRKPRGGRVQAMEAKLKDHEEALVKLRAEVARLTAMIEELATTPGLKYMIKEGKLVSFAK